MKLQETQIKYLRRCDKTAYIHISSSILYKLCIKQDIAEYYAAVI